jgi:ProP effector
MHEGIAQLVPNCFRQPDQPLKIGIHKDIIARHPELRPSLMASTLKTYTRSVGYLETLKAGAPRIDLDGNPAGEVTLRYQEHAERLIVTAARCSAEAIEDRKAVAKTAQASPKPVAKRAAQQNPIPAAECQQPAGPPRLGLAGLKAAALKRRQLVAAE